MELAQTITIPAAMLGDKWAGVYKIHILSAREYLQVGESLVQQQRKNPNWNGQMDMNELRINLVCKATLHNDKPVDPEMPSKLYEILSMIALPLNTISVQETEQLFLPSNKVNPPASG